MSCEGAGRIHEPLFQSVRAPSFVADRLTPLPWVELPHRKEGVGGSSPSEGFDSVDALSTKPSSARLHALRNSFVRSKT
jgi:hypothetical protein